ncbi:MAG: alpha/beta hydrolase [Ignavibacteriota bacterium]|mgnify:CR=1 FL=1|jgi:predicted alpha/beta superfamily hydrolase|nr:alpha/beta hydrolase [Ignavibacteriales bacterium]MBL1123145.1 alpha/beta hydrolase [Ignavibacteriota bacterium]MCC7094906.1 alpha/beta hydrolase [Ignavibacteriaceae bacterium]MCE7857129.1 alpha/beta hydrolase [Ignavibacteria bacterium CHB3]MEB2297625.1 alpha/beta hydrolase-fold protein [Ignavibacteria bacterium]
MKQLSIISILIVLSWLPVYQLNSQTISGEIGNRSSFLYNTTEQNIYSESVNDTFRILVSLPDNYSLNEQKYPVLYVLDGDIAFGMAASIARYLQIGDNIPELIIVGIGYGSIDKSAGEKRKRDYRPTSANGAENFLSFLEEELIPHIDSNYRTVPDDRTINGYSIGGLFGLYSLFTKPEIFSRYILGSPSLSWDDYSIFKYEENSPGKISDKKINIFISVGSEESDEKYFNPIDNLVTQMQERKYSGVKLEAKVFDGSTHLAGPPESLTHGLLSVFGKE